jgi:hypothetical protein
MTIRPSANQQLSAEINEVEDQLQESFKPVIPDPEFVRRLKHRLVAVPSTILEPRFNAESLFYILSGLSVALLILVVSKKIIDSFLSLLLTDRDGD